MIPRQAGATAQPAALAPERTRLPNGVVVLAKHTARTPAVTIVLAVDAGAMDDPPNLPGAMHLLGRTIDRGSRTRSADEIAEALDDRGISLTVNVTRHQMILACTCLAGDFDAVLRVLGDILIEPVFPESEMTARKGEILTAIGQDEDNPYVVASEGVMALLYGAHPYGWRLKGSAASVESMSRETLVELHERCVRRRKLTVVVVGDVAPERATAAAASVFGGWHAGSSGPALVALPAPPGPPAAPARPTPPALPVAQRRRAQVPMPGKSQADVAYGFVTIARADPAYYAYLLMNNVFGQYALGGRLGDSIREEQGMAYYVSSAFEPNLLPGPLLIRAGVAAKNVERTIASIDEEIGRLVNEGMTAQELRESQQYLVGAMPRTLETNAGIASFLHSAELFGLGLDFDRRLPELLAGVTLEQANEAARRALDPSCAAIVVAGPVGEGATAAGPDAESTVGGRT